MQFISVKRIRINRCLVCNSKRLSKLFEREDVTLTEKGIIRISNSDSICRNCGYIGSFNKPTQNSLNTYYKNKIKYKVLDPDYNLKNQINFFKRNFSKKNSVLEIGSGTNFLKKEMKKEGYFYSNSDISSSKNNSNHVFDIVLLNHVLEHISDPFKFIKSINKKLRKDGKIVVEVPDFNKLISRKSNTYFLSSEHLHHFTKNSLINIFTKCQYSFLYEEKKLLSRKNSLRMIFQKKNKNIIKLKKFVYKEKFATKIKSYFNSNLIKKNLFISNIEKITQNQKVYFWGCNIIFFKIISSLNLTKKHSFFYLFDSNKNLKKNYHIKKNNIIYLEQNFIQKIKENATFVICSSTWSKNIEKIIKKNKKDVKHNILVPNFL